MSVQFIFQKQVDNTIGYAKNQKVMSLHTVVSTGRGGAGNMISSQGVNAANEVIMTEEEWKKYQQNGGGGGVGTKDYKGRRGMQEQPTISEEKTYNHDRQGRIIASSGRGGAGNIAKYDKLPSPKIQPESQEIELSPVFSTGRGGAGNIHRTKSNTKTKINLESEIEDQLSPLHSNRSAKSQGSASYRDSSGGDSKFMKKLKKFFK